MSKTAISPQDLAYAIHGFVLTDTILKKLPATTRCRHAATAADTRYSS